MASPSQRQTGRMSRPSSPKETPSLDTHGTVTAQYANILTGRHLTIREGRRARFGARSEEEDDEQDQQGGPGQREEQRDPPGVEHGETNVNIKIESRDKDIVTVTQAAKTKKPVLHPQKSLDKYWKNFDPEYIGKVTKILPQSEPTFTSHRDTTESSQTVTHSYEAAKSKCIQDVDRIIKECRQLNQKYTDSHFDIERDLKLTQKRDCLVGLTNLYEEDYVPSDVKRVTDLFANPTFFADGADSDDIIQGACGDCWLLSGLSVLTCNPSLVERICVRRDQEVGVYGFVFYRDGEWHQTIIDDKLYLRAPAFDEDTKLVLQQWGVSQVDEEQKYIELFQRGSRALYFAKCRDENETWVPLLEKAMAKAHGGYDALAGGNTGEALEDLTGGVTTEIYTTNLLSKDRFWKEQLSKNGRVFLFGAADASYREWRADETDKETLEKRRQGQVSNHTYSVIGTYEGHGERLVKVRNPWGWQEWRGAWSDGSKEWNAEWLQRLDHKFSDDGIFWMSYHDFLRNYKYLDRTRIFDPEWYTVQKWATVQVPFSTVDYQRTKFIIELTEDSETVIVLSQLDDRYFRGFRGQYTFRLQFRVSKNHDESDYITRSRQTYDLRRSNNVELYLEKGKYTVFVKVEAFFDSSRPTIEQVIRANLPYRKDKVTTLGRLYDLAHRKGHPPDETCSQDKATSAPQAVSGATVTGSVTNSSDVTPDGSGPTPNTTIDADDASNAQTLPTPAPELVADEGDEDNEDEDKRPWNATCVIGLRVYSKSKDTTVGVVLPPKESLAAPTLDRDAITRAAQEEAQSKSDADLAAEASRMQHIEEEEEDDDRYEDSQQ